MEDVVLKRNVYSFSSRINWSRVGSFQRHLLITCIFAQYTSAVSVCPQAYLPQACLTSRAATFLQPELRICR